VAVAGGGHRLLSAEPGAGGEYLVEAVVSQRLADLRDELGLAPQGRTDAQIAAELFISVRTVGSHLDRIRDKTGCRRRAELTRLALSAGLV
jgi:DNA-binding CsgD family transcriptional regulator